MKVSRRVLGTAAVFVPMLAAVKGFTPALRDLTRRSADPSWERTQTSNWRWLNAADTSWAGIGQQLVHGRCEMVRFRGDHHGLKAAYQAMQAGGLAFAAYLVHGRLKHGIVVLFEVRHWVTP